jgi:hypothetical protein
MDEGRVSDSSMSSGSEELELPWSEAMLVIRGDKLGPRKPGVDGPRCLLRGWSGLHADGAVKEESGNLGL